MTLPACVVLLAIVSFSYFFVRRYAWRAMDETLGEATQSAAAENAQREDQLRKAESEEIPPQPQPRLSML